MDGHTPPERVVYSTRLSLACSSPMVTSADWGAAGTEMQRKVPISVDGFHLSVTHEAEGTMGSVSSTLTFQHIL